MTFRSDQCMGNLMWVAYRGNHVNTELFEYPNISTFIKNLFQHLIRDAYLSRIPWIFPGAPLIFNGAPGNIQGNLDRYGYLHDDGIKWKHLPRYWPWGESTGNRWIPLTKANDTELWCFLWSEPEQMAEQRIETPVIWDAMVLIMTSL